VPVVSMRFAENARGPTAGRWDGLPPGAAIRLRVHQLGPRPMASKEDEGVGEGSHAGAPAPGAQGSGAAERQLLPARA